MSPCFDEQDSVEACAAAVRELFAGPLSDYDYEHIFCDNASRDATPERLRKLAAEDPHIRVILNARNFGVFRSMFNGLRRASGDAVVPMLAVDLQDPPEVIVDFVRHWENGYSVAYGTRSEREESFLVAGVRKVYYRVLNRMASIDLPPDSGEFQLLDRKVVDAVLQFDDGEPYLRGLIAAVGFDKVAVPYTWKRRKEGKSKTNWYVMIDTGLNALVSFSNLPMRLCLLAGFGVAGLSLAYAFVQFMIIQLWPDAVGDRGIPTLIIAMFFLGGVQLFTLGMIGEYVAAISRQVRRGPLVVERELINFGGDRSRSDEREGEETPATA